MRDAIGKARVGAVLLACLLFAGIAQATDYHVATNGNSSGNGSLSSPWDLQTALNQPASVHPGDTIWVQGGTYHSASSDGFTNLLNGTASNPIIVRNYNGERATIDAHGTSMGLAIYGSYTWFWGLEVLDSTTQRVSSSPSPTNTAGVGIYGPGIKCINMVVHDTEEGFSGYNASPDSEYYGNLSYYNGYVGTDRNHGHGMYFQNDTGTKIVSDNFVGDNANEGIQIYGSGNATVNGFSITGNTLYNNESWPAPIYQYNLLIAGGGTRKNIQVQNNYSYFPLTAGGGYFMLGGYDPGQDMAIQNNVLAGGYESMIVEQEDGPVSFTGNTIVASSAGIRAVGLIMDPGIGLSSYTWDNNTYYDLSPYHFFFGTVSGSDTSGTNTGFSAWQANTGLDAHSTYSQSAPTGTWTYVRPNKYEAKRANITIYNWNLLPKVSVDLSSVLSPGDQYVIQDAQNFYGPPVVSGTYSGSPVAIPMTGLTKAAPIGFATPAHTAPQFGTFIVLPVGASSGAPPRSSDTTPPSVSILSPLSGASVSGSLTVSTSASDNVGVAGVQFLLDGSDLGSQITTAPYSIVWDTTKAAAGSHTLEAVARDAAGNTSSASITVNVSNGSSTPSSQAVASFVRSDVATQGNWKGAYGADGYSLADNSQSIPAYVTFAVQNQSTWIWSASMTDPRGLEKASGAGNLAAAWYQPSTFNFDVNFTDGNSHPFALYSVDWDSKGRSETIQIVDASTNAVLDSQNISSFVNGVYLVWNISGHVKISVTSTGGPNGVVSGVFFGPVNTSGAGGPAASFIASDTTTQGNWQTKYGADGYALAGVSAQTTPIYSSFALGNQYNWTWAASTADPRALKTATGSGRLAEAWYGLPSFYIDVNLTDGTSHQVALYAIDWDGKGRAETIQIVDAATNAVLDTRSISNFTNGIYLAWNLSGHVKINVTATSGPNAVISGIFFGTSTPNVNSTSASFLGTDTTTQGNWKGVYGLDGYDIPDTNTNVLPAYVVFTPQNQANYTWTSSGTETRDLQVSWSSPTNIRQASCWYTLSSTTYDLDVNLTDGNAHQLELYALDYDNQGRAETIQVTDAVSGAVLDTRNVTNFTQGIYYIWKLSGHVKISVTLIAGPNAVISGAFFK